MFLIQRVILFSECNWLLSNEHTGSRPGMYRIFFCLSGRKVKSIIALGSRIHFSAKAGLPFTLSSGKSENNKSEKSLA
jgi:hypothetical protein